MTLSRNAILGHVDKRIGRVTVPELGEVCIARLSVAEADQLMEIAGKPLANVAIVILGACDEKGVRLFTEADRDDLAKLPADAMAVIAKAIVEHNGYAEGNASAPTSDSASGSPSPSAEASKS